MSRVRTVVATELLLLLGLGGFVGAAYLIERTVGLEDPLKLSPLAAVALSSLPALLWLGYFYSQDRHEARPKPYVFGIYLLGAFVAGPIAGFIGSEVLAPGTAVPPSFSPLGAERLVMAFLVVGLSQELAKYAIVRYTVYPSPEFCEPMDGIIYMTAAGLGFATYQNNQFLQAHHGEVFLSAGVAAAVIHTLAHAGLAGVLGYALARAKFSTASATTRSLTLFAGLLAASALSGGFSLARDRIGASPNLQVTPWREVAFAFGFAAAIFLVVSVLMHRLIAASGERGEG